MRRPVLLLALLWLTAGRATADPVHHDLTVELTPDTHRIAVTDIIDLHTVEPTEREAYRFVLHAGLEPVVQTPGWRLKRDDGPVDAVFFGINATSDTLAEPAPLQAWRLEPRRHAAFPVQVTYGGELHHPLRQSGEEYQRSFSETPGTVQAEGVFLAGTTFWIPSFGTQLVTFDLTVRHVPEGWEVVSQGRRTADGATTSWSCPHPTEEVYLVGGPLHETCIEAGDTEACAFLREDDPVLAHRYLQATERYLAMYESILPPYPYASFALVENFWETGYGMPGFTLLGPQVIRFPWILTSSYPHELLHNWWGNSVYVDADHGGNWCEGLTAYMADHMLAEQRGEDVGYRRTVLHKYTDYALGEQDEPLSAFRSRTSAASEAIGYGKAAMLMHMVRRELGDEAFLAGLTRFHEQHAFQRATFVDLAAAFDAEGDDRWQRWFAEWTTRTGAPRIEITEATATEGEDGAWILVFAARQVPLEDPYPMSLLLTISHTASDLAAEAVLLPDGWYYRAEIPIPSRPLRVDVDPAFDVMRQLDPMEVEPSLSALFGADAPLFVMPSDAPPEELEAWTTLASDWARPGDPRIVLDSELDGLPSEPAVWVLGAANRFGATVAGDHDLPPAQDHSWVLVARAAHDPTAAVAWVAADPVAAIPGLARKLPHYTRYGHLVFAGEAPDNQVKETWPAVASPMVVQLGDDPVAMKPLAERAPLAEPPPRFSRSALVADVEALSSADMAGRGLGTDGLERATALVEQRLGRLSLQPAGDDGLRQVFPWTGGDPVREMTLVNLVATVPGSDPALADQPVVVMAHIDHLGTGWPDVHAGDEGQVHPGADDNASGVAVLLQLAEALASEPARPRPVVFAVTTGEEAGRLGARHLLEALGGAPAACVALDSVGRLEDGSLLVLDAHSASEWPHVARGVGYTTGISIAVSKEPLDSSDQGACLERGIPAIQLTTGPHADYHRPTDTADRVDGDGLVAVTEAALPMVTWLAERTESLTSTLQASGHPGGGHPGGHASGGHPGSERKASLGTVPDFAFQGPGVRAEDVVEGSGAQAAGMQAGDVVMAIDGRPIEGLRQMAGVLKGYEPGDQVVVTVDRDGEELQLTVVLGER